MVRRTNKLLRYRKRNTLRALGYALNGKLAKIDFRPSSPESTKDIFNYLFGPDQKDKYLNNSKLIL